MIAFETATRIARSIEDVFDYVAEPLNFPHWNSAVESVRRTDGTYLMERRLPTGRAENELEVVEMEWPSSFVIRTTGGPTPFVYRYRLSAENGETLVRLEAEADLGRVASLLGPLATAAVRRGVDENLAALKAILDRR